MFVRLIGDDIVGHSRTLLHAHLSLVKILFRTLVLSRLVQLRRLGMTVSFPLSLKNDESVLGLAPDSGRLLAAHDFRRSAPARSASYTNRDGFQGVKFETHTPHIPTHSYLKRFCSYLAFGFSATSLNGTKDE